MWGDATCSANDDVQEVSLSHRTYTLLLFTVSSDLLTKIYCEYELIEK